MTRIGPSKFIGPPPLYFLLFARIKKTENKWNDIYSRTLTFLVDDQITSHFPGSKRETKMSTRL